MPGAERVPGVCDYSVVLERATKPVICTPQLDRGYREKGDCARCTKARIPRQRIPVSEINMRVLPRERDIRNRRMNY